jgi:hypothetical protein
MRRNASRPRAMLQIVLHLSLFSVWVVSSCTGPRGDRGPFTLDNEALLPFAAMFQIDREQFCLSELADSSQVEIEKDDGAKGYDIMLHMFDDAVSRTVAFVWEEGRYIWIGEQETHYSGRKYMSPDGDLPESITIAFYARPISGAMKGLRITYWGDNRSVPLNLTCDQALSLIGEWDGKNALPQSK